MAAISLILGSVVGWIAAAFALLAGALASTAFIIFLGTGVSIMVATLYLSCTRAKASAS